MKKTMLSLAVIFSMQAFASGQFALIISKTDSNYDIVKSEDNDNNDNDNTVYTDCALSENSTSYKWFEAIQRGDITASYSTSFIHDPNVTCILDDNTDVVFNKNTELSGQTIPYRSGGYINNLNIAVPQNNEVVLNDIRILGTLAINGYSHKTLDLSSVIWNDDSNNPPSSIIVHNSSIENLSFKADDTFSLFTNINIKNNTSLKTIYGADMIMVQSLDVQDNTSLDSLTLTGKMSDVSCMSTTIQNNGSATLSTGFCFDSGSLPPAS